MSDETEMKGDVFDLYNEFDVAAKEHFGHETNSKTILGLMVVDALMGIREAIRDTGLPESPVERPYIVRHQDKHAEEN